MYVYMYTKKNICKWKLLPLLIPVYILSIYKKNIYSIEQILFRATLLKQFGRINKICVP